MRINRTFYEKHIKRKFDIFCAIVTILCFWWLYILVAIFVKIKLGSPVLFKQKRPGLNETVFDLYKFRTMTDERDKDGQLLPDEIRLTKFGKWLRSTSLDELPEVFNILRGDMSIVGPRPQLVKDMVFMTKEQRLRHQVRPGLTGLAQVNGRNAITWEDKFFWDLKYIEKITFGKDLRIIIRTVLKAFIQKEGITEESMATAEDLGDYLFRKGRISKKDYETLLRSVEEILRKA
ncbi:sugar transferase [Mordavella massiliensis]|uniref:sugar transferase n=1 Tax=Mordavella massiliensis TaxID=1871024 RepID=UPI00210A94FC|nr:sugar transferase [Mordavella massiliensis]